MDTEHVATKASLSLAGAAAAVDAAIAEASAMGVPVTVVVLDESGNPKRAAAAISTPRQ